MSKRLLALSVLCAVLLVATGFATTKKLDPNRNRSLDWSDFSLQNGSLFDLGSSVSSGAANLSLSGGGSGSPLIFSPGTPDNWNGGTGNWSSPSDWSAGEPGANSDVTINSGGNDYVTLDVSSSINSLTLGGVQNGTSTLTDGGNMGLTLAIAQGLTVGETGILSLSGGTGVTAGSVNNSGFIDLENGSKLTVSGDVTNNGTMFTSFNGGSGGNTLVINGTLTNNANAFFNEGFVLYGPGDSATIGSVTNTATGFVDLENASTLTVKGDVNNSGFLSTGYFYGTGSTLNINGTLNNYSGATFGVLRSGDIANVSELNNSGGVYVGLGATLNVSGTLTNNSGGSVELYGAGLGSMATIGSVVNAGSLDLENVATLTVQGDVSNSGTISTSGPGGTPGNTLTISGTLTNSGSFTANGPSDTIMIGSEVNSTFNSSFDLENGSTLTVAASGKGAQLRRERLGHYSRSGQTPTFFSLGPR